MECADVQEVLLKLRYASFRIEEKYARLDLQQQSVMRTS